MNTRLTFVLAACTLLCGWSSTAMAALPPALSNHETDALMAHVAELKACNERPAHARRVCVDGLGTPPSNWDRDKNEKLEQRDAELALAQLWGAEYVCDSNGAVLFAGECVNQCNRPTEAECADPDNDGLFAYQEAEVRARLGLAADYDVKPCLSGAECSFQQECVRPDFDHNGAADYVRSLCLPRTGCQGSCTAFHLVPVAQDDKELIVHVYYDYSPQPARVLDLRVKIPVTGLTLADSRLLHVPGKQLSVQLSAVGAEQYVRLTVYGTESSTPIPFGPVVELVFTKSTTAAGFVEFSNLTAHRDSSLAPNPEDLRDDLTANSLWGSRIDLAAQGRQLFHYHFDRTEAPAIKDGVSSVSDLCKAESTAPAGSPAEGSHCNADTVDHRRNRRRLAAMREGALSGVDYVPGVLATGARVTGAGDHIELPLLTSADVASGTSWSFWFRPDESRPGTTETEERLLWGHTDTSGNLLLALLMKRPENDVSDVWNLSFEQGAVATSLGTLTDRDWTHLGLAFSGSTATVFVNGIPSAPISLAAPLTSCPETTDDGHMKLRAEAPGERLLLATPTNQLYRVQQLDAFGTGHQELTFTDVNGARAIDPNRSSSFDPDFSPGLEKVAFVSTQKQNPDDPEGQDVWIANADGSDARRVTVGFGIPSRGVFVRRPRFSPDNQFLVFESNVFDAETGDNPKQVFRLFALKLDGNGQASVPVTGGATSAQARYAELVHMSPPVDTIWVRPSDAQTRAPNKNWTNLRWLSATEALVNESSRDGRTNQVRRLVLGAQPGLAPSVESEETLEPQAGAVGQPAILDARSSQAGGSAALVLRSGARYDESATRVGPYTITFDAGVASIFYNPTSAADLGKPEACWEQNFNYRCDASENLDGSKAPGATPGTEVPTCSLADCGPIEVMALSVVHGSGTVATSQHGDWLAANGRRVTLRPGTSTVGGVNANFTSIEITAPHGGKPVPPNTLLTRLTFANVNQASVKLRLRDEAVALEKWTRQGGVWTASLAASLNDQLKSSEILAGALAPELNAFVVSAVQQARPVLLRIDGNDVASTPEKLSISPSRVEGLDWEKLEPYRACHWMAGRRDPISGRIDKQVRGEFDEIKAFGYVRSATAMRSEYERGQAWLDKANPDGVQPPAYSCVGDLDCGPYQICEAQECVYESCSPTDACQRGQCTWVADNVDVSAQFACTVECDADSQCFSRECYNGPCRFCDASACIECRWNPNKTIADGVTVSELEGCPDGNRFMCESGSCVSECYSFENGQSRYLCTSNEYCRRGICVPLEWDWTDLAPATFASLGEMSFDDYDLPEQIVKSVYHRIELEAYATSDTGYAPQMRVQGLANGASPYQSWFDIGTIDVHKANVGGDPYVLFTRYPVTRLRFTMVAPPLENPNRAAVGFGSDPELCAAQADFTFDPDCKACVARQLAEGEVDAACAACGTPSNCTRMLGTRRRLGYPLHLRHPDVISGYLNSVEERDVYLRTGEPTIVLTAVKINGVGKFGGQATPIAKENRICRYTRGNATPADPADTVSAAALNTLTKGYAVLNCPDLPVGGARPEFSLTLGPIGDPTSPVNLDVIETGTGCYYNLPGAQPGAYPTCFAYEGAPSFDPVASDAIGYGSIDVGPFTSFGYDQNKLRATAP
jgi:hypothetical protein